MQSKSTIRNSLLNSWYERTCVKPDFDSLQVVISELYRLPLCLRSHYNRQLVPNTSPTSRRNSVLLDHNAVSGEGEIRLSEVGKDVAEGESGEFAGSGHSWDLHREVRELAGPAFIGH